MTDEILFWVFFVVWSGLMVAGVLIFSISKDVARKKKLWKPFNLGGAVLFGVFALYWANDPLVAMVFVPAIAIITFLNLRSARFCDGCGRLEMNQMNPFSPSEFCSKCGAKVRGT